MRLTTCLLIFGLSLATGAHAAAEAGAGDYQALKAKLIAGDTSIDFRALRMAYAASADYLPNSPDSLVRRKLAQDALEARKFTDAVTLIEKWLAADYLNPFAHLGAVRAYREAGNEEKAKFHDAVVDGLFRSICGQDQGLSENRPCPVVSLDEEHFYLVMNGFLLDGNYGTMCQELPCDVYEVTTRKDKTPYTIYFDISRPQAWLEARKQAAAKAAAAP